VVGAVSVNSGQVVVPDELPPVALVPPVAAADEPPVGIAPPVALGAPPVALGVVPPVAAADPPVAAFPPVAVGVPVAPPVAPAPVFWVSLELPHAEAIAKSTRLTKPFTMLTFLMIVALSADLTGTAGVLHTLGP